jgi:hypothetical protein
MFGSLTGLFAPRQKTRTEKVKDCLHNTKNRLRNLLPTLSKTQKAYIQAGVGVTVNYFIVDFITMRAIRPACISCDRDEKNIRGITILTEAIGQAMNIARAYVDQRRDAEQDDFSVKEYRREDEHVRGIRVFRGTLDAASAAVMLFVGGTPAAAMFTAYATLRTLTNIFIFKNE